MKKNKMLVAMLVAVFCVPAGMAFSADAPVADGSKAKQTMPALNASNDAANAKVVDQKNTPVIARAPKNPGFVDPIRPRPGDSPKSDPGPVLVPIDAFIPVSPDPITDPIAPTIIVSPKEEPGYVDPPKNPGQVDPVKPKPRFPKNPGFVDPVRPRPVVSPKPVHPDDSGMTPPVTKTPPAHPDDTKMTPRPSWRDWREKKTDSFFGNRRNGREGVAVSESGL